MSESGVYAFPKDISMQVNATDKTEIWNRSIDSTYCSDDHNLIGIKQFTDFIPYQSHVYFEQFSDVKDL